MTGGFVVFNEPEMARLLQSEHGDVGQYLLRCGHKVEAEAKRLASGVLVNVVTGRLAGSITTVLGRDGEGMVVRVGSNVSYARPVHEGTKPRVIVVRRAAALRFPTSDGDVVYARSVNHPGTHARPFLRDALKVLK